MSHGRHIGRLCGFSGEMSDESRHHEPSRLDEIVSEVTARFGGGGYIRSRDRGEVDLKIDSGGEHVEPRTSLVSVRSLFQSTSWRCLWR